MLLKIQHEFTLYIFSFPLQLHQSAEKRFGYSKCNFTWSFKVNVFGAFLVGREIWESPPFAS